MNNSMHYLMDYEDGIRVAAFGEIMLRLKSPGHERLMQSGTLEASFGGSEYNVLASLAQFGLRCKLVSQVPENDIGAACLGDIRSFGIETSDIRRHDARMGQYFLESGSNQRSGKVIYDRKGSAFAHFQKNDITWEDALADSQWFLVSGITPALSGELAEMTLEAIRVAKACGLTVVFDFNYRESLWRDNRLDAPDIMRKIVQHVDVLMASERDCMLCLDVSVGDTSPDGQGRNYALTEKMFERYPNLKVMSSTFRDVISADHHNLSAGLRDRSGYYVSRNFSLQNIVDRIGAGDAFAAGLIYGLMKNQGGQKALDFATAAACLKHSIPGDINRVTRKEIVELLGGEFMGQVKR
ncbi:sugar kinase [Paremcibacter congregatus]|uniref:sugar kinase n=1 Tax=Paremcibacter congregatus TaxID=2043170 RepID=UPI003A91BA07